MTPQILDGPEVANTIKAEVKAHVDTLSSQPGLAVVLVGDNPASKAYIGMKKKACEALGIASFEFLLPVDVGEAALIAQLTQLNTDPKVHGILLQMPLPDGYNEQKMLQLIDPNKDVDGFHPVNVGKLLIGLPTLKSCTPYGVCEMLSHYDIDPSGQHVVIMGRSNIVGKPLAAMLMQKGSGADGTVTVVHSRTQEIETYTKQADILIVAMGRPNMVTKEMVKPGAVVIDVGINRVDDDSVSKGYRLVGDVDFDSVSDVAAAITPVPGGVGPMTIAMLMKNTLNAYLFQQSEVSVLS